MGRVGLWSVDISEVEMDASENGSIMRLVWPASENMLTDKC